MKKKALIGLLSGLFCISGITPPQAASLTDYIAQYNPSQANIISQSIVTESQKYGVDPLLMSAIFWAESRYSNTVVSSAGAIGIAQLMPDTAKEMQVNPYDIQGNIEGGIKYYALMLQYHANKGLYQNNFALASYNAGYGNATNTIPSYTYEYINSISKEYQHQKSIINSYSLPSPPSEQNKKTQKTEKEEQVERLLKLKELLILKMLVTK